jgi:hypothetical protein
MEFAHDLPAWLKELLPEPALPAAIKCSEGKYYVHYPENGEYPESAISGPFENIIEAYESINVRETDPIFDESLPELQDPHNRGGMIWVESDLGPSFSRSLISSTEDDHLRILQYHYNGWRESVPEYFAKPDDFLMAYYFLDGHPCFWTRQLTNSGEVRDPFGWKMSGHAMELWSMPQISKTNPTGVSFMMEAGAHLKPDYITHGRDFRMDVYGESYEDAIIQTAALIHKFFDLEGNERENVDYVKSQLEVDLEDALARSTAALSEVSTTDSTE